MGSIEINITKTTKTGEREKKPTTQGEKEDEWIVA